MYGKLIYKAAAVIAVMLFPLAAFSMAPKNDKASAAIALTGTSGQVASTNVDATADKGEQFPPFADPASVWYTFKAPTDGWLALRVDGSNSNGGIPYLDLGTAFFPTSSVDPNTGDQLILVALSAGTTVKLRFYSAYGTGDFNFSYALVTGGAFGLTNPPQPGLGGSTSWTFNEGDGNIVFTVARFGGTEGSASVDYAINDQTGNGLDVFFTGPTSGTLNFAPGVTTQTVTLPISDTFDAGGPSNFTFDLSNPSANAAVRDGSTFFVIEDDKGAPSNDNFAQATVLTGDSGDLQTDAGTATSEKGEPAVRSRQPITGQNVWYQWTASADGILTCNASGLPIGIFQGASLATLQQLAPLDQAPGNAPIPQLESNPSVEVKASQVYYIAIYNHAFGPYEFTYSFTAHSAFRFSDLQYDVLASAGKATLQIDRLGSSTGNASVTFATRQPDDTDDSDDDSEGALKAVAGKDFLTQISPLVFAAAETSKTVDVTIDPKAKKFVRFSNHLRNPSSGDTVVEPSTAKVYIHPGPFGSFADGEWQAALVPQAGPGGQGLITIKISPKGVATGSLVLDGNKASFVGPLPSLKIGGFSSVEKTFVIPQTPHNITVKVRQTSGADGEHLTGLVDNGVSQATFAATFGTSFGPRFPAPNAGVYTIALAPDNQTPAAAHAPGYLSVTITASGKATLRGSLPDGTPVMAGSSVSFLTTATGFAFTVPFYIPLYNGAGQLDGVFRPTYPGDFNPPAVQGDGDASVRWVHPVQKSGVTQPFVSQLGATVSRYSVAKGALALPGVAPLSLQMTLSGGALGANPLTIPVTLGTNGFSFAKNAPNAPGLTLTTMNGIFSGKFTPTGGKSVSLQGILLRNLSEGRGFFPGGGTVEIK